MGKGLEQTFLQIANKNMKRCSESLSIREMQIRTTIRYLFAPVKMAIFFLKTENKCWQLKEKLEPLNIADGNVKW